MLATMGRDMNGIGIEMGAGINELSTSFPIPNPPSSPSDLKRRVTEVVEFARIPMVGDSGESHYLSTQVGRTTSYRFV